MSFYSNNSDIKLSKLLTWILRHSAVDVKIKLDGNGWANLDDILKLPKFNKTNKERVFTLVRDCPKQRFAIKEADGYTLIRACQGHTIKEIDLELTPILSGKDQPFAYHGTYLKVWDQIKKNGLSRMKRQHIHFAPSPPKSRNEASGIRQNCQIIIEVDVTKLILDNFKLYLSENKVVLCEGNEKGFIPPKYFSKVLDKKTGKNLLIGA